MYVFLVACSIFLSACRPRNPAYEEEASKERGKRMIRIENVAVAEKTLTLNYQVSNPFKYDIWVCEDVDIYGNYDVETRITPGTLHIRLCFHLECNLVFEMGVFAKYRRLLPGESHSGKILLNLPIRNASPVYRFDEDRTKYKQVLLQRAVFEVGYMEGRDINAALEMVKRIKRDIPDANNIVNMPKVRDEIADGQSHTFAYVPHIWPGLSREISAKVVITDVAIPCSVVIDEK